MRCTNQRLNYMYAGDARSRNLYQKLVQETCTINLHEKFHAKFITIHARQQLAGQSRFTVRVTCRAFSVLE